MTRNAPALPVGVERSPQCLKQQMGDISTKSQGHTQTQSQADGRATHLLHEHPFVHICAGTTWTCLFQAPSPTLNQSVRVWRQAQLHLTHVGPVYILEILFSDHSTARSVHTRNPLERFLLPCAAFQDGRLYMFNGCFTETHLWSVYARLQRCLFRQMRCAINAAASLYLMRISQKCMR